MDEKLLMEMILGRSKITVNAFNGILYIMQLLDYAYCIKPYMLTVLVIMCSECLYCQNEEHIWDQDIYLVIMCSECFYCQNEEHIWDQDIYPISNNPERI